MTRKELYSHHVFYKTQLPAELYTLLKGLIDAFYAEHGTHIDTIIAERIAFQKRWLRFEVDKDEPKRDGTGQVIMLPGLKLNDYKAAYKKWIEKDMTDGVRPMQKV